MHQSASLVFRLALGALKRSRVVDDVPASDSKEDGLTGLGVVLHIGWH